MWDDAPKLLNCIEHGKAATVHGVKNIRIRQGGLNGYTTVALQDSFFGFLANRPLRYLGKISYGLYVFHLLGIAVGIRLSAFVFGKGFWWIDAILAFVVTLGLSVLSYEFFERWFLKLKKKFEIIHSRSI